MKKELKDYLHFYMGCEMQGRHETTTPLSIVLLNTLLTNKYEMAEWKPILRPLSDMKKDEMKELWQLIFKREFAKSGRNVFFEAKGSTPTRWVLMSGVERLGIENDGNIWADSDLHNYRFNQHEVTMWLLFKHFDLFGLIEYGLAIDKTTLNK